MSGFSKLLWIAFAILSKKQPPGLGPMIACDLVILLDDGHFGVEMLLNIDLPWASQERSRDKFVYL